MSEIQKQIAPEIAKIEALKAGENTDAKINEYCDQVIGTAMNGTQQLTDLEGKLESTEAKAYLKESTPGVVNKLSQIAEKGRSALNKKKVGEQYIVFPDIETLHSGLKEELNSLKNELTIFERIETADAELKTQLGAETAIVNNPDASLDERLNAYNGISTGLSAIVDKLPKEVGSATGREYLQKINGSLTAQFERITYERQNLNIAKRITAGGGLRLKLKPGATDIDLTKIQQPGAPQATSEEPLLVMEGSEGRDYGKYFNVDNRGGITMTPSLEELSKSNPEEYRKIIGDLYKESGGMDLTAAMEEVERVRADVEFYKSCVDEYERNPTMQNREIVLQNSLPGGRLPPMNGRAGTGNPALDAIYAEHDHYTQEYNDASKVFGEASSRFEKLDLESNNKVAEEVLSGIDASWAETVAPTITAYNSFEGKGFKEIMNTIGLSPDLIDAKKLDGLMAEHGRVSDDALKMLFTVTKLTTPLKNKPLDAKTLQHLNKITNEVTDKIDRIESNKLKIKTVASLQGIPEIKGSDISRFVMILDKPNEQGKRYVIFEEELNKLPKEQREIVKSRIDKLVEIDLQAVKEESAKIVSDGDLITPEAEAKMREKFGKNGEKYFQAMDALKNGDLRASAGMCREFIALANGLKEKERNELQDLVNNANETLKLIGVRQVSALEELYSDLGALQYEQLPEVRRHDGNDPGNAEMRVMGQEIAKLKTRIEKGEIFDVDAEVGRITNELKEQNKKNGLESGKIGSLAELYNASFDIESADPAKREKAKQVFLTFAQSDLGGETGNYIGKNNPAMYKLMKKYLEKSLVGDFADAEKEAKKRGLTPDSIKKEIVQNPKLMGLINNLAKQYYEDVIREQPELKDKYSIQKAEDMILNRKAGEVYRAELQVQMKGMDGVKDGAAFKQYAEWFPAKPKELMTSVWEYGKEDSDALKKEMAAEAVMAVVTLPVGMGAGAVGKMVLRAGMAQVGKMAGFAGFAAKLGVHVGSLAAEGFTMMALNDATQLVINGQTPAYLLAANEPGHRNFGMVLAQNILMASSFRALGVSSGSMFAEGSKGARKFGEVVITEYVSGAGGAAISIGFMVAEDPSAKLDGKYLAKTLLSSAVGSLGSHYSHGFLGGKGAGSAPAKPAETSRKPDAAGAKKPAVSPFISVTGESASPSVDVAVPAVTAAHPVVEAPASSGPATRPLEPAGPNTVRIPESGVPQTVEPTTVKAHTESKPVAETVRMPESGVPQTVEPPTVKANAKFKPVAETVRMPESGVPKMVEPPGAKVSAEASESGAPTRKDPAESETAKTGEPNAKDTEKERESQVLRQRIGAGQVDIIALEGLIKENKISAGDPAVIDFLVKNAAVSADAMRMLLDQPGVKLNRAQQVELFRQMENAGAKNPARLLDAINNGLLDPNIPDVHTSLLETAYGMEILEQCAKSGTFTPNEAYIDKLLAGNRAGFETIKSLSVTDSIPEALYSKYEKVFMERKQVFDDAANLHRADFNLGPEKFRGTLKDTFKSIEGGSQNKRDPLVQIMERLKTRDPEAYKLLQKNIDAPELSGDLIRSVADGNYREATDDLGKKIRSYEGELLGEGGLGRVFFSAYSVDGGDTLQFGAMKVPRAKGEAEFRTEVQKQKIVREWDHPNINKALHLADKFIIYETGPNSMDLQKAFKTLPPAESLRLFRQAMEGVLEYQRRGYIHGDLKPANILVFDTPTGRKAVLIDNSPLQATQENIARGFPHTRAFMPEPADYMHVAASPDRFYGFDNHSAAKIILGVDANQQAGYRGGEFGLLRAAKGTMPDAQYRKLEEIFSRLKDVQQNTGREAMERSMAELDLVLAELPAQQPPAPAVAPLVVHADASPADDTIRQ